MRTEAMQRWERAEVERSSIEAALTPDDGLRVSSATLRRYDAPPADTSYPLEYCYHLLGDVRGKRIVDFGCGSGMNTVLLAARGADVWGIDISEDLLRLGQRRLTVNGIAGTRLIAGSAHETPFPAASFDIVFGMAILHHLDLAVVAREVHRILKPGGRAIFKEPVRNSRAIGFLRSLIPYHAPGTSRYERPLTDGELGRFSRGFSPGRVRAFGLPHVQLGRLLPIAKRHRRALYAFDGAILRELPFLARYASVRVMEFYKG